MKISKWFLVLGLLMGLNGCAGKDVPAFNVAITPVVGIDGLGVSIDLHKPNVCIPDIPMSLLEVQNVEAAPVPESGENATSREYVIRLLEYTKGILGSVAKSNENTVEIAKRIRENTIVCIGQED